LTLNIELIVRGGGRVETGTSQQQFLDTVRVTSGWPHALGINGDAYRLTDGFLRNVRIECAAIGDRYTGDAELLFDAKATKDILTFFFPAQQAAVDSAAISNPIRNFAQGLLVAAVDASYAMSWVELTFDWVVNPGSGVKNALRKLGLKAVRPGSTARKTGICARRRSTKR
jgi:hypothetical protein